MLKRACEVAAAAWTFLCLTDIALNVSRQSPTRDLVMAAAPWVPIEILAAAGRYIATGSFRDRPRR